MAWVSTDPNNWATCQHYLTAGGGVGAVNAISIDNLYVYHPVRAWQPHAFLTRPRLFASSPSCLDRVGSTSLS